MSVAIVLKVFVIALNCTGTNISFMLTETCNFIMHNTIYTNLLAQLSIIIILLIYWHYMPLQGYSIYDPT